MKQIAALAILGLLTLIGGAIELFMQHLPPQVVQINGLLTIIFAMAFVILALRIQAKGFHQ